MKRVPITLNFYNKDGEIDKTYSKSIIPMEFFERATKCRELSEKPFENGNLDTICEFVCDYYDNKFTAKELKKKAETADILSVATQISYRIIMIMKSEGMELPNPWAAAK